MKGIYAIYKRDTNECLYVGQSKCIEKRVHRHFHRKPLSVNDWHNIIYNNEHDYYYKVLEECDADIRGERERYYIAELKPIYNVFKGGESVWDEYPESAKEKLRQYSYHRYGEANGMYNKRWITNGIENKCISPDEIDYYLSNGYKLGQTKFNSLKGKKRPIEFCKKMSKLFKGRKMSEEQKIKLSNARKETIKNSVIMYKGKKHAFVKKSNIEKYLLEGYTFENTYKKYKQTSCVSKD